MNTTEKVLLGQRIRNALFADPTVKQAVPEGSLSGTPVAIADALLRYADAKIELADPNHSHDNAATVAKNARLAILSLAKEGTGILEAADRIIVENLGRSFTSKAR